MAPSSTTTTGGAADARLLGVLAALASVGAATFWLLRNRRPREGKVAGRVQAIYVYPVKSFKGIKLEASAVEPRGLLFDRLWMVVDGTGRFRTQRQLPKMALVQPSLPSSTSDPLVLAAPGMPPITVPVAAAGPRLQVRVWGDTCEAFDQGDAAARWLREFLGQEDLRLVRMDPAHRRQVDRDYAVRGQTTGFADGFPFLLANQSSLEDLNSRLAKPVPMDRFRPNIIVEGPEAWAEDGWRQIAIGDFDLRVVKPCSRCKMPNIDQATSEVDMVVTAALKTFRTGEQLGIKIGDKTDVYFGQNVVNDKRTGTLRVGDAVTVFS